MMKSFVTTYVDVQTILVLMIADIVDLSTADARIVKWKQKYIF